jgi:hypothetical protein
LWKSRENKRKYMSLQVTKYEANSCTQRYPWVT